MNGNVSLFPVRGIVCTAKAAENVVWIITVGATTENKYSCKFRDKEGYWRVNIETRDLIDAIILIEKCGAMINAGQEKGGVVRA